MSLVSSFFGTQCRLNHSCKKIDFLLNEGKLPTFNTATDTVTDLINADDYGCYAPFPVRV